MSYFDFENKRLFYTIAGTGKPLLLLHRNTASSKMFDPIVPLFLEKNAVIRMDFLGCGQSERLAKWPTDLWYSWSEQAAALLKHLGLRKVNVIGCSGGALAALNLALDYPALETRLRRIVLREYKPMPPLPSKFAPDAATPNRWKAFA